jgi:hypothetical protein
MEENWKKEVTLTLQQANPEHLESLVQSSFFSPKSFCTYIFNSDTLEYKPTSLLMLLYESSGDPAAILKCSQILCNRGYRIPKLPHKVGNTILLPQSEDIFTFFLKESNKDIDSDHDFYTLGQKILNDTSCGSALSVFALYATKISVTADFIEKIYKRYRPFISLQKSIKQYNLKENSLVHTEDSNKELESDGNSLLHVLIYNICSNVIIVKAGIFRANSLAKKHYLSYDPIEHVKIIAFLIAEGGDPFALNGTQHNFFDIKNICISLLRNDITSKSLFSDPVSGKEKSNFVTGFYVQLIKYLSDLLNESQKNKAIDAINKTLPSIEYITNLTAYYALNGHFPKNHPHNSISQCLIHREYGIKNHNKRIVKYF